jgi:hypothetical protein
MPPPFSLVWVAGTTVPLTFNYNRLDGTIPPLAGAEIWVTFKNNLDDADPGILQKTLSGGKVVITDAVNGVATCYMTPAESTITGRQRIYQVSVKIKEANSNEWPACRGTLTLTQDAKSLP